jgi:hypothetical protein
LLFALRDQVAQGLAYDLGKVAHEAQPVDAPSQALVNGLVEGTGLATHLPAEDLEASLGCPWIQQPTERRWSG